MSAPAWADALVTTVCADAGMAPPRLAWRRRHSDRSTGVARRGRIVATLADGVKDDLRVLSEVLAILLRGPDPLASGQLRSVGRTDALRGHVL